jgi:hypothetical protein
MVIKILHNCNLQTLQWQRLRIRVEGKERTKSSTANLETLEQLRELRFMVGGKEVMV